MQDEAARSGSMMETVKSAWGRRKWLAVVVFAVPLVTAASLIMFMPSVYKSTATILVDRQQIPESMVRPTVTSALETRLQTISQEILSRSRLDALIRQFDLYADQRHSVPAEELIGRLRKDIKLELKAVQQGEDRRSATISFDLSYEGRNPETVARVTNTLASFYVEENLKARERQAVGTSEFLKVQLAEAKKRLDAQEQVVSDFKKRYMGELPQQTDANLGTVERISSQLLLSAAVFPLLPGATRYAMATLKRSVHNCYFCYHGRRASLEEEVNFFQRQLGPFSTLVHLLALRGEYRRSFAFVIRCVPTLVRLHLRTVLDNRFPREILKHG